MYTRKNLLAIILCCASCFPGPALRAQEEQTDAVLRGRIVDDTGEPVTDAKLTLRGPGSQAAMTNEDGYYEFSAVRNKGEFRIRIVSSGWIGITDWKSLPRLELSPDSRVVRDFTLPRAGQVPFRVVDEEGAPIRNARIYVALLADAKHGNSDSVRTDPTGWVVVGGLKPSKVRYIFGVWHDDYAYEKHTELVTSSDATDVRTITMQKGVTVQGKALCADDKPAAGWLVKAMPAWWHYGASPRGVPIADDGSFTLEHILPGEYQVSIGIPKGAGSISVRNVLAADLLQLPQPVQVKIDQPSPGSMVEISGRITIEGQPTKGVWLEAFSKDRKHSDDIYLDENATTFKFELPKGIYTIRSRAVTIEPFELENVTAPTKDLEILLKEAVQPVLAGKVVLPDGKTPANHFRISIVKTRSLKGNDFSQDSKWKEIHNADGAFSVKLNGHGVYVASAIADGFAMTSGQPFDTTKADGIPIEIVLDEGVALSGIVVDDQGQPIAGAQVQPLSSVRNEIRNGRGNSAAQEGSTTTDPDGRFLLAHLPRGPETLRVTSEGHAAAEVTDLDLATRPDNPLTITMHTGGTIRGLAFDGNGKRIAGRPSRRRLRTWTHHKLIDRLQGILQSGKPASETHYRCVW